MDLQEISLQQQAGKAKLVKTLVQQAIDEGIPARKILKEGLLAGMNVVGADACTPDATSAAEKAVEFCA